VGAVARIFATLIEPDHHVAATLLAMSVLPTKERRARVDAIHHRVEAVLSGAACGRAEPCISACSWRQGTIAKPTPFRGTVSFATTE
jgi:hypothetical protein